MNSFRLRRLFYYVSGCPPRRNFNSVNIFFTELFSPSHYHMLAVTEGLKAFQSITGQTWTSSIILSTLLVRTAVAFPLYTYTEKNQALVSKSFLSTLATRVKQPGNISPSVLRQSFRADFMKRCQAEGCHPLKSAAFGLIQLPLWITLTCGLRNACGLWVSPFIYWPPIIPEFLANGLASPTQSLALVVLLTFANLANAELAHLRRLYMLSATEFATKNSQFLLSQSDTSTGPTPIVLLPVKQSWQLHFVHGLGLFGAFLVSAVSLMAPSALTIFWCTSSVHQLLINLLHLSPRVRHTLRIPTSFVDPKRPYITLWLVALQNYRILAFLRPKKL